MRLFDVWKRSKSHVQKETDRPSLHDRLWRVDREQLTTISRSVLWDNLLFIILKIFSLARDWFKRVTWPSIPQFSKLRCCENIWRIINSIASFEIMVRCLSLDIICSSKLTVFRERELLGTDNVRGQILIRAYFRAKWRLMFYIFGNFHISSRL